jgi:hypothetical protein
VKRAKKKPASKPGIPQKTTTLESISGSDALAIIKILSDRNPKLAHEIDAIARELLSHVNIDDVAANVQMELEYLDVEDVWNKSGATSSGYVDPGDAAWEMFEEALEPFRREMDKYKQLSMLKEAELTCQGILKGIYLFDQESATEYKNWAIDAPGEYFGMILGDWKKLFAGQPGLSNMKAFLETHCTNWADWAIKSLRSRQQ